MTTIRLETLVDAPIETVYDLATDIGLHARSMAATREHAINGTTYGRIGLGETVTWKARHFGVWWTLTSRIAVAERPTRFVDEQASGPFRRFRHVHTFRSVHGSTLVVDEWEHTSPFGPLGWLADRLVLDRHLRRLLEVRNAALKREAEATTTQVSGYGMNAPKAVATATKSGRP